MSRLTLPSVMMLVLGGCYGGNADVAPPSADGGVGSDPTGVPCDVSTLMYTYCYACHSGPRAESGIDLTTYDSLVSMATATETVAQRCLVRMRDPGAPMPPSPATPPSASDIDAFAAWIDAGYPRGSCGDMDASIPDAGPSPYDTPTVCTSGTYWTRGNRESPYMHPGLACNECHRRSREGPIFDIAGTVYPSAHEPDDCNGINGSAGGTVVIIDATGRELDLIPNAVGNFGAWGAGLVTPYQAKVVFEGRERVMVAAQTNGDCNSCHTLDGTESAPGRIMLP